MFKFLQRYIAFLIYKKKFIFFQKIAKNLFIGLLASLPCWRVCRFRMSPLRCIFRYSDRQPKSERCTFPPLDDILLLTIFFQQGFYLFSSAWAGRI